MRVRIKICGITRETDALAAARLGADALGFVFWPNSRRFVTTAQAERIVSTLPPFVTPVALFVNPEADEVRDALAAGCELLQFHGDESPAFCASFGRPWLKAVRVAPDTDIAAAAARYAGARGLLLDTFVQGSPGGTGQRFDWARVPRDAGIPLVLAGGLTPENVGDAIRAARPWAVDVSGGVEVAPGIKDHARMAAFIEGVRRVDEQG